MTQRDNLIRRSLCLSVVGASVASSFALGAQAKPSSGVPATAPTQSVSDLPSAHPAITENTPRGESHITWTGTSLTVQSGGSALPEIIQQIARETGMKITGGIPDERVFGTYGPGPVQVVMGQLFDGLAINMMLINGSATTPKELVLTTRSGAGSAPQVRQVSNDSDSYRRRSNPALPAGQQPRAGFGPQQRPTQEPGGPVVPAGGGEGAGDPPRMPPDTDAIPQDNNAAPAENSATPAAGTDEQQSPEGVRTPEQIFEELRKRQQEQQQQQTAPPQ